jgi:hypothetical protein
MDNIKIKSDSADLDNSFCQVDEKDPSSCISIGQYKSGLSALEELSAIPKPTELESLKQNSSELSKQLRSKLTDLKPFQSLISTSDLEDFLRIDNYIKCVEEKGANNEISTDLCMDIDYLENIRKQQELMVKLLKQISLLQWEVEQGYKKIKENEENLYRTLETQARCDLENEKKDHTLVCSCLVI